MPTSCAVPPYCPSSWDLSQPAHPGGDISNASPLGSVGTMTASFHPDSSASSPSLDLSQSQNEAGDMSMASPFGSLATTSSGGMFPNCSERSIARSSAGCKNLHQRTKQTFKHMISPPPSPSSSLQKKPSSTKCLTASLQCFLPESFLLPSAYFWA